jgi:hypothetical protein
MRNDAHFEHLISFRLACFLGSPVLGAPSSWAASAERRFLSSCRHQHLIATAHGLMHWRKWLAARRAYCQRDACSNWPADTGFRKTGRQIFVKPAQQLGSCRASGAAG